MVKTKLTVLGAALLSVTSLAHPAIECFQESVIDGGPTINTVAMSDLDLLVRLDPDHVLTSVKVCTDRAITKIKGLQTSYGKFDSAGEITDAVYLNSFGNVEYSTAVCTIFYVPPSEYIAAILYRYNDAGVTQLWLTTNGGKSSSYGIEGSGTQTVQIQYSDQDYMFFGFQGRERENTQGVEELLGLGTVRYDAECLNSERRRQGQAFSWGIGDQIEYVAPQQENEEVVVVKEEETEGVVTPTQPSPEETDESQEGKVTDQEGREEEQEQTEDDDGMPIWLQMTFIVSFLLNFFFIVLICLCCMCRRRSSKHNDMREWAFFSNKL